MAGGRAAEGRSIRLVLVFVATRWLSYVSFQALPLIIGALIAAAGLSPTTSGALAGAELLALAVTAQRAARSVNSTNFVLFATVGSGLAAAGQLLTATAGGVTAIAACRVASGVGAGFLAAAANASLSAMPTPERWFSRIGAVGSAVAALLLGGLPVLAAHAGQRSVFVAIGVGMLIALACARALPRPAHIAQPAAQQVSRKLQRADWILLAGVALFSLGQGAIWAFAERLSVAIGVSASSLGLWFLAGSLVGIGGSLAAGWTGSRLGRTRPIVLGVLTGAVGCLLLSRAGSQAAFGSMLLVYFFATQFVFPLLFGLSAVLDTSGMLVTASTNVLLLTSAAAPVVGGALLVSGGFAAVGWLSVSCCGIAAAMFVAATRGLEMRLAHRPGA